LDHSIQFLSWYVGQEFEIFKPAASKEESVNEMLDQVVTWTGALQNLRK